MSLQLLLVEDNARTAAQIIDILHETPYQVTLAKDGLDGLSQAKKGQFDVVLMDHKMPLMDGFALLRNLRDIQDYAHIPLIFMTTEDPRQAGTKARRCGADAVLAKPMQREVLLSELSRLAPRHVA